MIHKQLLLSFKHEKEYKKCEYHENIRPLYVWKAAYYLMQNSDLYKNLCIKLDTRWLNHVVNKESDIENMSFIVKEHDVFPSTSNDNYSNASEMNTQKKLYVMKLMKMMKHVLLFTEIQCLMVLILIQKN